MGGTRSDSLKVAVVSKLALDSKPASSILSVGDAHSSASDLRWLGLHCERDVFLQSDEFLINLSLERIRKHTAVRGRFQGGRG